MPAVLVHGDMWSYNLMWLAAGDGKTAGDTVRAIIDWQTCHTGGPTEDIAEFLCTSIAPATRRQHTEAWLRHYYIQLQEHMQRYGKQAPFTFARLRRAYDRSMPLAAAFSAYATPLLISKGVVKTDQDKQFMVDVTIGAMQDALKVAKYCM